MKKITLLLASALLLTTPAMAQFEDGLLGTGTVLTSTATTLDKNTVVSLNEDGATAFTSGQWIKIETSNITSKSGDAWINITQTDNSQIAGYLMGLSAKKGVIYAQVKGEVADYFGAGFKIEGDSVTVNKVSLIDPNTTLRNELISSKQTAVGSWTTYLQTSAGKYANVVAGDILYVYTSALGSGPQGAFQNASWKSFAGTSSNAFSIAGDYWMVITDAIAAELQSGGATIYGQNYTVDSVVVKTTRAKKAEGAETVLSSTETVMGNWAKFIQIMADNLSAAKAGDVVKVYTKDVASDAQGSFKNGSWNGLSNGAMDYFGIDGDFTLTLTDALLTEIRTTGDYPALIIGGKNYTATKVTLQSSAAENGTAIWTGSTKFDGWGVSISLGADMFSGVEAGDKLVFVVDSAFDVALSDPWTYGGQVLIKKMSGWADFDPAVASNGKNGNPSAVPVGDYKSAPEENIFTFADPFMTEAKTNGLIIQGMGLRIVKILIRKGTATAIKSVASDDNAETVGVKYYNVAGAETSGLNKGINIVRKQLSNGKSMTEKVIVK